MASFAPGTVLAQLRMHRGRGQGRDRRDSRPVGTRGLPRAKRPPSSTLINRVISSAFAGASFVFGGTCVGQAFTDPATTGHLWWLVLRIGLFAGLLVAVVGGAINWHLRWVASVVAVTFVVTLVGWPFAMNQITAVHAQTPWIWGLCNLATAGAAIGMPDAIAAGYVLVVSVAWALIRLTPAGGGVGLGRALQDSGYTFILGLALLMVIVSLQHAAARVDLLQSAAAARYAATTREHEAEKERAAVDALLHDSVMTTLLTAPRARTAKDRTLLTRMARNSLTVISDHTRDSRDTTQPVTAAQIRARFARLQEEIGTPMELAVDGPDDHSIPFQVTDALFAGTGQALINSIQHAGPGVTRRTVNVTWTATSVRVVVTDDGIGFNPDASTERLGVRGSIIGRLTAIGGTATIDSAPGHGTRITMSWTDPMTTPTGHS